MPLRDDLAFYHRPPRAGPDRGEGRLRKELDFKVPIALWEKGNVDGILALALGRLQAVLLLLLLLLLLRLLARRTFQSSALHRGSLMVGGLAVRARRGFTSSLAALLASVRGVVRARSYSVHIRAPQVLSVLAPGRRVVLVSQVW